MERLYAHWVYGGFLASLVLLAMAPLLFEVWPSHVLAVYLALPAYMVHQYEEHDRDRFRLFVNRELAAGRRGLSLRDVFWINIVGVWALLCAALILTVKADPAWGLVAAYLLAINALVHVAQAVALRRYNPGLATAALLFLPLGGWILIATPAASSFAHAGAAGLVVVVHAVIVALAARRPR